MTEEPKDRREYCSQHCYLSEKAKASVPRWAFISAVSASMIIALSFGGWHISSLKSLSIELAATQLRYEQHVDSRIQDANNKYIEEVARFIVAVRYNRGKSDEINDKMDDIKSNQIEFRTKQDLVLKKLELD